MLVFSDLSRFLRLVTYISYGYEIISFVLNEMLILEFYWLHDLVPSTL
jgi:hypothetical protein